MKTEEIQAMKTVVMKIDELLDAEIKTGDEK